MSETKEEKEVKETKTVKKTVKKPTEPKVSLFSLVDENDPIIMGALFSAGLYSQYLQEKQLNKDLIDIPETITEKEFNKIINNYIGV